MKEMTEIIILILIFNFISCSIARIIKGGRFTYNKKIFPNYNGKMILISGMLSQPENVFKLIHMPYGCNGYLNYSLLGYNPKSSGKQLAELTRSKDFVVGVSIGCKSILLSHHPENRRVFVNPMTHSIILKPKYQMLIQYLSPIAEVLSHAIGWLAVLPVIRTGTKNFYSIALLVDQLYWMYYGDPHFDDIGNLDETGVITSTDDEFLENHIIEGIYNGATFEETYTRHGYLADPDVSNEYDQAINNLLAD